MGVLSQCLLAGVTTFGSALDWVLAGATVIFLFFTFLPISKNPVWYVRGADFPRLQFSLFGLAVFVAMVSRFEPSSVLHWLILGGLVGGMLYQAWWILPFTVIVPKEVKPASSASRGQRLRILSANVLMTNRRYCDFLAVVKREDPDVIITLETNGQWERTLASIESTHPFSLKCPLENLYGMHVYSRWPIEDARIQFLVEKEVPSMHMLIALPDGKRIRVHSLHPAPPSPSENETSEERDAELIMVGKAIRGARFPVIVTGDLNDVAWSRTTRRFRKLSRLLDPRVGRGMFNTFHAKYFFMRWPVDHFFHSREFSVLRMARLENIGSDHFPVLIDLVLGDPSSGHAPAPDDDDQAEAEEAMNRQGASENEVHQPGESSAELSNAETQGR